MIQQMKKSYKIKGTSSPRKCEKTWIKASMTAREREKHMESTISERQVIPSEYATAE